MIDDKRTDEIINQYKSTVKLIEESKQDRILIEFNKCIQLFMNGYKEILDSNKQLMKIHNASSETYLKLYKSDKEIHDKIIEIQNLQNKQSNEFDKEVDNKINNFLTKLYNDLSICERAIYIKPREFGFYLLLFGRKTLQYAKKYEQEEAKNVHE